MATCLETFHQLNTIKANNLKLATKLLTRLAPEAAKPCKIVDGECNACKAKKIMFQTTDIMIIASGTEMTTQEQLKLNQILATIHNKI